MDLESSRGMEAGAETVYGTHEDSYVVMSEKVQSLAGSIYQEFERMISRYDEDVVKSLMPLLVNVLECLDAAYKSNQEQDVELELLREDNEQLVTQYEREKSARKQAEQKLLETEDVAELENKELSERLESLESIVKMLELKHKNSMDHSSRLEEREGELKKEYSKLHDRYTELFKTHMDYMERTKILLGAHNSQMSSSEILSNRTRTVMHPMSRSSGPMSYGFASLEVEDNTDNSPPSQGSGPPSLQNELHTMDSAQETDSVVTLHQATSPASPDTPSTPAATPIVSRTTTHREQRSANTLYQELCFSEPPENDADDGAEVTGSWVHPGEYASSVNDNFFGMGKEVENLIMENNELLATKNALNIVKDDLIVKVDELTGEQEILRDELMVLQNVRAKLKAKITELEDEIRRLKEEHSGRNNNGDVEEEADVPMAQRKRFTRVEMARVLMERNQYKERFMELQEAVRWTEMIRASRSDPQQLDKKSKQGIWKFFSNLFSSSERPSRSNSHLRYHISTHGGSAVSYSGDSLSSGNNPRAITDNPERIHEHNDRVVARRNNERREQYRQVRAHVRKEDGRLQAYGWSLPGSKSAPGIGAALNAPAVPVAPGCALRSTPGAGSVPVPVPVYCRPLAESSPHMKIWCGAGANLNGGVTRDGGCMVGNSIFYSQEESVTAKLTEISEHSPEVEQLDKEVKATLESGTLDQQLSSFVWICTTTHAASTITVINAVNPAEILSSFNVCSTHLLCIASVPGAVAKDYTEMDVMASGDATSGNANDMITGNGGETIDGEEKAEGDPLTKKEQEKDEEIVGRVIFVKLESNTEMKKSPSQEIKEDNQETTSNDATSPVEVAEENFSEKSKSENCEEDESNQSDDASEGIQMNSIGPTMWLGAQNGDVFVHSSVATWNKCLHKIRLADAVLCIVHSEGRVVAALANGTLVVFRRNPEGIWNLNEHHIITVGSPQHSVRCLAAVGTTVWCGYRNKVHVLDPVKLSIVHSLEAHPRRESQVRQMAWLGEGVWVSIRLDSTLRLYHALTYQHLQDVDIEPYVSKMLGTGKLGFSFVRITALLISSSRLWIGTGNGVIISVPLSDNVTQGAVAIRTGTVPGSIIQVSNTVVSSSFIPYCSMAHAQLSFHGHRDAVKFFVAVPGTPTSNQSKTGANQNKSSPSHKAQAPMLVMSGGEGYIDFRIGDGDMEDSFIGDAPTSLENEINVPPEAQSHLIVWQVTPP